MLWGKQSDVQQRNDKEAAASIYSYELPLFRGSGITKTPQAPILRTFSFVFLSSTSFLIRYSLCYVLIPFLASK